MGKKEVLKVKALSVILGLSEQKVRVLARDNFIPGFRTSSRGAWGFSRTAVGVVLASHLSGASRLRDCVSEAWLARVAKKLKI